MEDQKFLQRLQRALDQFDTDEATRLSVEIHEAEDAGYQISPHEDRLWYRLTAKIADANGTRLKDTRHDH